MKYKILIAFLFISQIVSAQFVKQSLGGAPTTINTVRGAFKADSSISITRYPDTATANVGANVKKQDALLIVVGDTVFLRDATNSRWVPFRTFNGNGQGVDSVILSNGQLCQWSAGLATCYAVGKFYDSTSFNVDSTYEYHWSGGQFVDSTWVPQSPLFADNGNTIIDTPVVVNGNPVKGFIIRGTGTGSYNYRWAVLDSLSVQPLSPIVGNYLVGTSPSGAQFTGNANNVGYWNGSAWTFESPLVGDILFNLNNYVASRWTGSAWVRIPPPTSPNWWTNVDENGAGGQFARVPAQPKFMSFNTTVTAYGYDVLHDYPNGTNGTVAIGGLSQHHNSPAGHHNTAIGYYSLWGGGGAITGHDKFAGGYLAGAYGSTSYSIDLGYNSGRPEDRVFAISDSTWGMYFKLADTVGTPATNIISVDPDGRWRKHPVSGGGGGSPAGVNKEIQFNDSGNFGADGNFRWAKDSSILWLDAVGYDGANIKSGYMNGLSGYSTDLNIKTSDAGSGTGYNGGSIIIKPSSGDGSGTGGQSSIYSGDGGITGDGGAVTIYAGPGGASLGSGGNVNIYGGGHTNPAYHDGAVIINSGNQISLISPLIGINGAYQIPSVDGTSGQVLKTNGLGIVTWQADGGGSTVTQVKRVHEIATMGNSMTANGGYQTQISTLLNDTSWVIRNYGVSGDATSQMVGRMSSVTKTAPDVTITMGGINDIVNNRYAIEIETNLQTMYTAFHNTGSTVVAVTILPFGGNVNWTSGRQATLDSVNTWILATATNVNYKIDAYTALENPSQADHLNPTYSSSDSLHPNTTGYTQLGTTIYNGTTFTKSGGYQSISFSGNQLLDQDVSSLGSPNFNNLTTATLNVINRLNGSSPMPRMTTSQVAAIPSPTKGMMAYDSTLGLPMHYTGSFWSNRWYSNIITGGDASTSTLTLRPTSVTGTTGSDIVFKNGAGTTLLTLQNNGYSGFGNSPQYPLDVNGITGLATTISGNANYEGITSARNSGGHGLVLLGNTTDNVVGLLASSNTDAFIIATRASSTNTERLRLTNTGKLGIGVAAPTAYLNLPPATATAATGQIKFTNSTALPTTPELGLLNFKDGLLFVDSSTSKRDTVASRDWVRSALTASTVTSSGNNLLFNGNTYAFPAASATMARTDAAQTFTGTQTMSTLISGIIQTFTTGTSSNFYTQSSTGVGASVSTAAYITNGNNIQYRVGMRGVTGTVATAANDVFGVAIGDNAYTEATSGTSALGGGLYVKTQSFTNGTGATTDFQNAYIGDAPATTATNNYALNTGFTNIRANLKVDGAQIIGATSPAASASLDVTSTTKGVLFPRMTTTQKNAISSPAEGLMVYDITLHKLCLFTGSVWETVTSL